MARPRHMAKRALDVTVAAAGLAVLSPLLAAIAVAIKLESRGPVLFCQDRVGRDGNLFRMFKFRSMRPDAPRIGPPLTAGADTRITRVGHVLRRTKLDELPQLINVLAGAMSLVGPRPEVPRYMAWYTPEQRDVILSVKPGMTDYASILFRNEAEMLGGHADPELVYRREIMPIKYRWYARYAADVRLGTDLRVILATLSLLLMGAIPKWLGIPEAAGLSLELESDGRIDPRTRREWTSGSLPPRRGKGRGRGCCTAMLAIHTCPASVPPPQDRWEISPTIESET